MYLVESLYREYSCSQNNPLTCDRPLQTAQEVKGAKFCLECGFPATLPQQAEIKGSRGSYQVTNFLGVRGNGRLYSGIQLQDKESVVIKEYLLPNRCFNHDEISDRKESFKRVAGVKLADGRNQNFRLEKYWESIADDKGERCYLITKEVEASQTLRKYLTQNRAMTPEAVREVLNQALQTLEFLHTQKLRFPSNQVEKGIPHGNVSLDSILINSQKDQGFYIYLCDLYFWEKLFLPPSISQPIRPTREQDLESLGLVAFYLWVGITTNSGQPLDPRTYQKWPNTDDHLKQFIYRLMGLETPFESTQAARQELLKLPKPDIPNSLKPSFPPEDQKKHVQIPLFVLAGLGFLLLGGGIWFLLPWIFPQPPEDCKDWKNLRNTFNEVPNIPPGNFTYTGAFNDTWTYVLTTAPQSERLLNDYLKKPISNIDTTFNYQQLPEEESKQNIKLIQNVLDNKYSFAITSLQDNITDKLNKKPIAYNGLLVFVASSKTNQNLPKALMGQISIQNLRKIYTGEITNWQQLGGPDIPVEPYAPTELEAIRLFESKILKNDPQDIAKFDKLVRTIETAEIERKISREVTAKRNPGIIGFGIFSKTWAQCNGYPLAIQVDNNKPSIQPLFREVGRRPINPSDDLCDHRNYFDVNTVRTDRTDPYPLGYPLFVVYPKDNSRPAVGSSFADLLTTRQGQYLISKVGLVTLQPIPKDDVCKSLP